MALVLDHGVPANLAASVNLPEFDNLESTRSLSLSQSVADAGARVAHGLISWRVRPGLSGLSLAAERERGISLPWFSILFICSLR